MKLSDALLRFAAPLLDLLPPDPEIADVRRMLELGHLVWNAVVLEQLGQKSPYLAEARNAVRRGMAGSAGAAMLTLLTELQERKRAETPPDLRLIGEVDVSRGPGGDLQMRVTQVAPPADEKRAAPDTWSQLYAAARELHSLAPWHRMWDREVFGIRDPVSGEIGWCCVLGAGGELQGLAIYRGHAGFDHHRRLQSGELDPDEALYGQDAFLVAFVDRSDVAKRDLQRLRRLGFTFRGARSWPQIESHATGRLPVPLSDEEADHVLCIVRAAMDTIIALRDVPHWAAPDSRGRLLVLSLRDGEWHDERVAPPAPIERVVPAFDAVRAERLKRSLKASPAALECDLLPMPFVIEERKGHPYMPPSFLCVDPGAGIIVHQQLGEPKDRERMAQAELMSALERFGAIPAQVRVRRTSLVRVLAPLADALGTKLAVVDELPMIEEVAAMAAEFFQRSRRIERGQRPRRGRR